MSETTRPTLLVLRYMAIMLSLLEATRCALLLTTFASGKVGAQPRHHEPLSKIEASLSASESLPASLSDVLNCFSRPSATAFFKRVLAARAWAGSLALSKTSLSCADRARAAATTAWAKILRPAGDACSWRKCVRRAAGNKTARDAACRTLPH